jgi:hypothetical protein
LLQVCAYIAAVDCPPAAKDFLDRVGEYMNKHMEVFNDKVKSVVERMSEKEPQCTHFVHM